MFVCSCTTVIDQIVLRLLLIIFFKYDKLFYVLCLFFVSSLFFQLSSLSLSFFLVDCTALFCTSAISYAECVCVCVEVFFLLFFPRKFYFVVNISEEKKTNDPRK